MAQAVGFTKVLGVISGILGIISFGENNFKPPKAVGSVVNIAVGLDYEGGLQNAGGNLPDVRLFNEGGEFLGMSTDPGDVADGAAEDITINHKSDNGQQATYGLFSANDNAICVAYLTITWPDGNKYGWTGDWGSQCGGTWYYSNVYISGPTTRPKCLWIDANGDTPQTGFQIHFPEFVTDSSSSELPAGKDVDYFCNRGPPFQLRTDLDPRDITYWVLNGQTKRSPESHQGLNGRHHLRRFDHKPQPRQNTYTSRGPDFANIADESFCRMSDKSLWPICSPTGVKDNCFSLDLQQLIIRGKVARDNPYDQVGDWTLDN
ncbi:hypothetical protein DL98DRAFT_544637 [Cadophora sp. DSE1049]|nr:hypothetical protein DL98DRAFT_544637 [Cadophora sp. DSE1049]